MHVDKNKHIIDNDSLTNKKQNQHILEKNTVKISMHVPFGKRSGELTHRTLMSNTHERSCWYYRGEIYSTHVVRED